jgi:LacI family transcriptional regulator
MRGRQIIEVCQREKIRVPEDIAVLGVDNDELLCEICRPALSSILPDTFRSGYIAASLLDRLIRGLPLESMEYRIKPLKIVRRRSTDIKAIDDPHIAKAMRYIHEKALDGPLTVNQILKIIPFSRRIFEKRFKDYIGRTPTQEIERIKIERIKELLLETDISLMDIAEKTGIQHQSYMGYIFKKQVGVPPAAYRKQHR